MEKKKRFRERIGMVFRVPLRENNQYAYGQVATEVDNIFFDHVDTEGQWTPVEQILQKPVIFYVTVDQYVLKQELWEVLGVWPVDPQNTVFPDPFVWDDIAKKYFIMKSGVGDIPATIEDIQDRELLSSWGEWHVEDRLRDHFAGRPNYFVEEAKNRLNTNFPDMITFYKQYGVDINEIHQKYYGMEPVIIKEQV